MRIRKYKYILRHQETNEIITKVFNFEQIFNGMAKLFTIQMKHCVVLAVAEWTGYENFYEGHNVKITCACDEVIIGVVAWEQDNLRWAVDIGAEFWELSNIIQCQHLIETIGSIWEEGGVSE